MYKLNNCINGVVVRVLQSIVVDRGFEPAQIKRNIIELLFTVSPQMFYYCILYL